MIGRDILHYHIRQKLGAGGMGEVYLAHDGKLDREVAIKFLPPSLQNSPEARARLLREAQAASRLAHPNIVSIYAVENADNQDFIVMEYVRGQQLADMIAAATLSLDQALELARQIADALSIAHESGVVHRDIKTSNILVTDRGQAKMLDFGLATFYGATQVTDAGSTMGTASYMSPEQTQGRPIDSRSDLFSFGVVLYEMITGRRPFDGENRNTIAYAICNQTPEPLSRFKADVPPVLENIVGKALRKDPTERYQTASDMVADIKVAARESGSGPAAAPPYPPAQHGPPSHSPPDPHPGWTPGAPPQAPQTPYPPAGATPPGPPGTPHTPGYPQSPPTPSHSSPPSYPSHPPGSGPAAPYPGTPGHTPSQPMPPYAPESKSRTNLVVIAAIIMGGLVAITAIVAPRIGGNGQGPATTQIASEVEEFAPVSQVQDDRVKIAVLPFENLGSKDDEYFAEGVTEEITARLAAVRDLGVIARSSVEPYKGSRKSPIDIGRELEVDFILQGRVRWEREETGDSRVRVTPELVKVADGTSVWGDVYDEPMTAVFRVQSQIAKAVVDRLGVALLEPEQDALESALTDNMEAYDAYLKGMRLKDNWTSSQDLRVAAAQFEKATSLDPKFVMAYVRQAETNADMVWFKHDASEQRVEAARRAAQRAMDINPDSPDARWAMGWYYYHARRDLENALRYLEPVLEERPNSADAHAAVAFVQRRQGQWQAAIENLTRAVELSPNNATFVYSVGECYRYIGEFAKSRPYLERATRLRPEYPIGRLEMIIGYVLEGDLLKARREAVALTEVFGYEEFGTALAWVDYLIHDYDACLETLRRARQADNNSFYRPAELIEALVHRATGDAAAARASFEIARDRLLTKLEEDANDFRYHGAIGMAYAGLGMRNAALQHAERAIELLPPAQDALRGNIRRFELTVTLILLGDDDAAIDQLEIMVTEPGQTTESLLRNDPIYDSLRDHPRFKALFKSS